MTSLYDIFVSIRDALLDIAAALGGGGAAPTEQRTIATVSTNQDVETSETTVLNFDAVLSGGDVVAGVDWLYTVPVSGLYQISVQLLTTLSTWTVQTASARINLRVNGVVVATLAKDNPGWSQSGQLLPMVHGSAFVNLVQGDTFDITMIHTKGTPLTIEGGTAGSWIDIRKLP